MLSVTLLLVLAAFVCVIADALGKCPPWVWGVLLIVVHLLGLLPR